MKTSPPYAAYIGRFNPVHVGHCAIIKEMLDVHGLDRSLLVIGSCTAGFSLRHFFSYEEHRGFIRKLFPDIRMVGLPDYGDDRVWLAALDDILEAVGMKKDGIVFYGGCEEDVRFFSEDGRICHILNRFDGTTAKTSATEVRDALIFGRPLDGLVPPDLIPDLKKIFETKWEQFKRV